MVLRLGFLINPIAGIGGPAGHKGSDGMADAAAESGYAPTAAARARRFLSRLKERAPRSVRIFAAPGVMGASVCRDAGWKVGTLGAETMLTDPFATTDEDTAAAAREAHAAEMDLLVFVGGDGTARDVARALGDRLPALGVPAGVKMFSECFAETPEAAADLVAELARPPFDEGDPIETRAAEVLDLDEEAYRCGEMQVVHHTALRVPDSPRVQAAKCPACPPAGLEGAVGEVALRMAADPHALYLLGSGSTVEELKRSLGVDGTLIGIDAVTGRHDGDALAWEVVARDADARTLEHLVDEAQSAGRPVALVLSPIGGQGFIVGRGTGPVTPHVLRAVLPDRLWILATPGKLASIEDGALRVDTGDPAMDRSFPPFIRVVVGVEREKMVRLVPAA